MMRRLVFLFVICSSFAVSAKAGVIPYGNLTGTNLFFNGISESSSSISPPAVPNLFGAPTVSGNMLIFSPTSFEAKQTGNGAVLIDGQLNVTLAAKPGFLIAGFKIEEDGDYTLTTPFAGGQAAASASVAGSYSLLSGSTPFTLSKNFAAPPGVSGVPWNINIPTISFAAQQSVGIVLNDTLTAAALTSTDIAFIKKKNFKITVSTVPSASVPEPTSIALMLVCGIVGLPLYRKR